MRMHHAFSSKDKIKDYIALSLISKYFYNIFVLCPKRTFIKTGKMMFILSFSSSHQLKYVAYSKNLINTEFAEITNDFMNKSSHE